ncbi:MAG: hypothetical protein H0W88_10940 [Parachlamydiaceae bacterium]|nr:hypothetical protein [Parachlamydiaceae bacterium]
MKLFLKLFIIGTSLLSHCHLFSQEPFEDKVYISNSNGNKISIYDTITGAVTTTVDIGGTSTELALTTDGKQLYILKNKSIYVLDAVTQKEIIEHNLGNSTPEFIAITPDGSSVYVTATNLKEPSAKLYIINTATQQINNKTLNPIISPTQPGQIFKARGIAITQDGQKAYAIYNDNKKPANSQTICVIIDINNGNTINHQDDFIIHANDLITIPNQTKIYGCHQKDPLLAIIATIDNSLNTSPILKQVRRFAAQTKLPIVYGITGSSKVGNITLIDANDNSSIGFSTIPGNAWCIALSRNGTELYVTDNVNNQFFIVVVPQDGIIPATPLFSTISLNDQTPTGTPWGVVAGPSSLSPKVVVLPPTNLKGKVINKHCKKRNITVHLTWDSSPDPTVVSYNVYRFNKLIGTVSSNSTLEFNDHNRKKNRSYIYKVRALNAVDDKSNPISVTVKT